ncbi:putative methyltransferase PMT27 [Hordeum vulgare]|nr:putative methyltransferase PMT27 [Hordeum vulgare]
MYTNDLIIVKNSINTMEQLLAEDDKYRVVGFNLEYTDGCAGYDQKVGEKKKHNDSLLDLAVAIIDPYYRDMKAKCDKDKFV